MTKYFLKILSNAILLQFYLCAFQKSRMEPLLLRTQHHSKNFREGKDPKEEHIHHPIFHLGTIYNLWIKPILWSDSGLNGGECVNECHEWVWTHTHTEQPLCRSLIQVLLRKAWMMVRKSKSHRKPQELICFLSYFGSEFFFLEDRGLTTAQGQRLSALTMNEFE